MVRKKAFAETYSFKLPFLKTKINIMAKNPKTPKPIQKFSWKISVSSILANKQEHGSNMSSRKTLLWFLLSKSTDVQKLSSNFKAFNSSKWLNILLDILNIFPSLSWNSIKFKLLSRMFSGKDGVKVPTNMRCFKFLRFWNIEAYRSILIGLYSRTSLWRFFKSTKISWGRNSMLFFPM